MARKRTRGRVTAKEFQARLTNDFEYRRRVREREAILAPALEASRKAHGDAVRELVRHGLSVTTVQELAHPNRLDLRTIGFIGDESDREFLQARRANGLAIWVRREIDRAVAKIDRRLSRTRRKKSTRSGTS